MKAVSDTVCTLGEGPLWHPERKSLFWFDILGKALHCLEDGEQRWAFDDHVSAAGWVDQDTLLMASSTGLWRFDIASGARTLVVALEADNPVTRSNDGRADPQGGFWIGTMGIDAEPGAGAIYRYYRGELRCLYPGITVPNAICFSPHERVAYFSDTITQQIMRVALDADGWPEGAPQVFIDMRDEGLNPDGAVVDATGHLWNAQWGAWRVACYDADGRFLRAVDVPASQASCPAFGGPDLKTLYVTTALVGVAEDGAGLTYATELDVMGHTEHRVIL